MLIALRNLFFIGVFMLLCTKSYAGTEPYENFLKGSIKKGDSLIVKDEKFRNPFFNWAEITNIKVQNNISLRILSEQAIAQDFSCKMLLRVEYFSSPEQVQPTIIDTVPLNVNYKKATGANYQYLDNYQFENGYLVKVKVLEVNSPEFGTSMPPVLQLNSNIVIERKYQFKAGLFIGINGQVEGKTASKGMQRLTSGSSNGYRLDLSWELVPSAEEYDIEWVTVDEGSEWEQMAVDLLSGSGSYTDAQLGELFRNNATRITTEKQNYSISLIYSAKYILVRMRQVAYTIDGLRQEDSWLYKLSDNVTYGVWPIDWHEPKLNWQYAGSYAEEGKKKEVVSYFDGTLRGRQTVTVNNEDQIAVIQENVYDQFGRVVGSILPAPYKLTAGVPDYLHYFKDFNLNTTGKAFDYKNLNLDVACDTLPQPLKLSSGAGNYYSAESQVLKSEFADLLAKYPFQKYTPNANGYPFSVTKYTADNTGKIKEQGGVGQAFQPRIGDSHTSKYYYSKPDQWELDRLFGNDVGYAEHYLKNMVVDPNGQVSISYLNASGKTIATALTGKNPDNTKALDNLPAEKLDTIRIISPQQFKFDASELKLTATTTYANAVPGVANLKYDIEKLITRYPGGAWKPCSNCYFELTITVKDDCQQLVYQNAAAVPIGSKIKDCNFTQALAAGIPLSLNKIGEYFITFEFAMNRKVIEDYTKAYVDSAQLIGHLKKRADFVKYFLNNSNFATCFTDCKTARAKLGTKANFTAMFNAELDSLGENHNDYATLVDTLYNNLLTKVAQIEQGCIVNTSPCDLYRIPMLADVSPGGQYAMLDSLGNFTDQASNIIYLYFHNGAFNTQIDHTSQAYLDSRVTDDDGNMISPYDATFTKEKLIKYWQPEWAEKFLEFHPEYCKLQFCNANSTSVAWDNKLKQTAKAQDVAAAAGVSYNDSNPTWLLAGDPFFAVGGAGYAYRDSISLDLSQYSTRILKATALNAKNISQFVDYQLYCADATGNTNTNITSNNWNSCTPNGSCRVPDREWTTYLDIYLDLKAKYFDIVRKKTTCLGACEVGQPLPSPLGTNCTETFTLGASGQQLSANQFKETNYSAGTQTTYTFVVGAINSVPNTADYCSSTAGQPVFYKCIKVVVPGVTNPVQFYNVWKITCTGAIGGGSCNTSGYLYADNVSGSNTYQQTQAGITTTYTITQGSPSQAPNTSCSGLSLIPEFYDCYTVYVGGNTYSYTSVWVEGCTSETSGGGGGGGNCDEPMPQSMKTALTSNNNTQSLQELPPCEEIQQLNASKTSGEQFVASYYDQSIYSVQTNNTSSTGKTKKVKTPLTKAGFGPYELKEQFVVQTGPRSFAVRKNVWVATYQPDSGSVKYKENQILSKMAGSANKSAAKTSQTLMRTESFGSTICTSIDDSPFNYYQVECKQSYYQNEERRTTIFLHDGNGNPVAASAPVTVTVQYNVSAGNPSGGSGSGFTQSITIPTGQSSAYFQYTSMAYADEGLSYCVADRVDFGCVESITGSSFCDPITFCDGSTVTPNPCPISLAGKKPIFEQTLPTNLGAVDSTAIEAKNKAELQSFLIEVNTGRAETWMEILAPGLGAYNSTQITLLKAKLIELSVAAGDATHPSGASSLPAGHPGIVVPTPASGNVTCFNFGDVMKAALGISAFNNLLNPWLLETPYPYEPLFQATDKSISNASAAICAKLTALNTGSWTTAAPFYAHLVSQFGDAVNITEEELGILMKGCGNCRFILAKDIPLPVFLEPGTKGCITKSEYNAAIADLNTAFGTTVDSGFSNYQTIVTNYLNHKFGFAFTFDRYQEFITGSKDQLCNEPPFSGYVEESYACVKSTIFTAFGDASRDYDIYIEAEQDKFRSAYISNCAAAKAYVDLEAKQRIYHYTLYYYDMAGNLVRTVPPEGVTLLNKDQIALVQKARDFKADDCTYNGPTVNANENTALQTLSNTLANTGNSAVELWVSNTATTGKQFIAATPDMKYMFQACVKDNLVNVDIYSLTQSDNSNVTFTLSNHVTANVSSVLPLSDWTHIVVQGSNLAAGTLQIWVNGVQYTPVAGAPSAGCSWEMVSALNQPIIMPRNFSMLKHLRLYNRLMAGSEIWANAKSGCLAAVDNTVPWYRFNGPVTAEDPNLLVKETQYNELFPMHGLTTSYAYNSTGQVVQQQTPDAGISKFWYDYQSRLIASQNAKQQPLNDFSYTKYDQLGRIVQVGQKNTSYAIGTDPYLIPNTVESFLASGSNREMTETYYDEIPSVGGVTSGLSLNNLRKRVVASIYRENTGNNNINASYYNYDVTGNVKNLYQQIYGLGVKKIDYEYDLHSGKVNFVAYQHGANDRFYYQYAYDAENRLTDAYSGVSANVVNYGFGSKIYEPNRRLDAHYQYYLHGFLARTVLGEEEYEVQGIDYAYTLQGWLKGVNGNHLDPNADMGGDGKAGSTVAKDALAYSLGYYTGDYQPISTSINSFGLSYQQNLGDITGLSLHNGNISNSTYAIAKINNGQTVGYSYTYDQLHRLKSTRQQNLSGTGSWNNASAGTSYGEDFVYDGNGNIKSLQRYGQSGLMDQLSYGYSYAQGKLLHNRLNSVTDATGIVAGNDMGSSSYTYDAIGNLLSDAGAGISNTSWNVYGKIKQITKTGGNLNYSYDPSGNRVSKTYNNTDTYYVRDARSNLLAIYEKTGGIITWKEQELYGNNRLGNWNPDFLVNTDSAAIKWSNKALKHFELSNHLGNVLAVINGNQDQSGGDLKATVINAQDYYAFGSQMPNRSFNLEGSYRYGFNGKENDNEVKGEGNQQDYGMRIYDPRIAKFLSVDPITNQYPELTPYQFASNTPIWATDLDGLEADYGKIKAKKLEYPKNASVLDAGTLTSTFITNTGLSVYNGAVDAAETIVNTNPAYNLLNKGAGYNKIYEGLKSTFNGVNNYLLFTTPEQQQKDIYNFLVNPHTWEDVAAAILSERLLPKIGNARGGTLVETTVAKTYDVTVKGALKGFQGVEGVYVHEFTSGTAYVGQAVDLSSRPVTSLKELLDEIRHKGTAAKAGDSYGGVTRFFPLEGSGFNTLNDLEADMLSKFGGTMKDGGKTYNLRRVPGQKK